MEKLVKAILESYEKYPETCSIAARNRLNKDLILEILEEIRYVIFPGFFEMKHLNREAVPYHVGELLEDIDYKLKKQVAKALYHKESKEELSEEEVQKEAEQIVTSFLNRIPALREILATDVQAAYEGDPAAFNTDEVIFSYPGVFAITVNRVAHELHRMGVPLIPRMMTEYAHNLTGIDIHPGAVFLYRPRHRGGSGRNHRDRESCEALPGSDPGSSFYQRRPVSAPHQASPYLGGQCDGLLRSFHFRRGDCNRRRSHHWVKRVHYLFCAWGHQSQHQKS